MPHVGFGPETMALGAYPLTQLTKWSAVRIFYASGHSLNFSTRFRQKGDLFSPGRV